MEKHVGDEGPDLPFCERFKTDPATFSNRESGGGRGWLTGEECPNRRPKEVGEYISCKDGVEHSKTRPVRLSLRRPGPLAHVVAILDHLQQFETHHLAATPGESPCDECSSLTRIIAAATGNRETIFLSQKPSSPAILFMFKTSLCLAAVSLFLALPGASAQTSVPDHPTVALVNTYFKHVVDEDWKAAAAMLSPASLERKKIKALELVKRAPTMTAESEMLGQLGVKELKDLEAMSATDFYAAERSGVARKDEKSEAIRKQKQESLKVNVLGVILEQKGAIAHLAVRTSQAVLDKQIEELIFISFQQDEADKTKWFIVPDMQMPVTTPLPGAEGAAAAPSEAPKGK